MWLTAGRYADELEALLATRMGRNHARLVCSGSAANLVAFSALTSERLGDDRVAPGSEVITVAAGFPTTVAPIIQNGCVPVFVDVDLETANAIPERVAEAVTDKTRAIVLAHTLGNPFDLRAIMEIATRHQLQVIEDCCDALGATFDGRPVGSFGTVATLSFYPAHHITTGEGGAVMADGHKLMRSIESFRDWGRDCWCPPGKDNTCQRRYDWDLGDLPAGYDHKYIYSHLGYNVKMTDMQAALGVSQLAKADGFIAARRDNHAWLVQAIRDAGLDEHLIIPQADGWRRGESVACC